MTHAKKLIEVAMPLDFINKESAREKSISHGHPSTLHIWWARRPLAACRAVLFSQLVDDPSSHPDLFPTEESQTAERQRLFGIIKELVKWENIKNERVLNEARKEILRSTGGNPPHVVDPFCGGGSIPLEATRLGLTTYASDLNPVAVLITKALIDIPARFSGNPPVHAGSQTSTNWQGTKGLAEDVRYYGEWVREEAKKRIGHLYPKLDLPKINGGGKAKVIAWLWARTVKCPNPTCGIQMPLARSFTLSSKRNKKAWVEPIVEGKKYRFDVRIGTGGARQGTVNRRGASCLCCGSPVPFNYIRSEGKVGRLEKKLMAIVAEGERERIYAPPSDEHESIALQTVPDDPPDTDLPEKALGFRVQLYGMTRHSDLFTARQLTALSTFSDLVREVRTQVREDALRAGFPEDGRGLEDGGLGCTAYAEAIGTYLAFGVGRSANYWSTLTPWGGGFIVQTFGRQALPMVWDFAEANVFSNSTGNWRGAIDWITKCIVTSIPAEGSGVAMLADATSGIDRESASVIFTDPPYYDNIGYADLSDYFYVWLRRSLTDIYPHLFSTMLTPKTQELIASPYRFGGDKGRARKFFEEGLEKAFNQMRKASHKNYPLAIYYAFKQAEGGKFIINGQSYDSLTSTGWETMLEGLIRAQLQITGTWPLRTERDQGLKSGTNVLASSIVLACRPRSEESALTTRRDFLSSLKGEMPSALKTLQHGNIAPVDLAQAAIGPGMAIFSRYSKVLEADGSAMSVRAALALINQVLDEYLAEQEGEYDADTRWAVAWFEQHGAEEGPFGEAETLSKAKNTAVDGLVSAGILLAKGGKVRLLRREELTGSWDPTKEKRLTVWEVTQHLILALMDFGSEEKAAAILDKVGALGDVARDLAYRLYTICDRKKWAQDALAYNSLVVAWPELVKLAGQQTAAEPTQEELF